LPFQEVLFFLFTAIQLTWKIMLAAIVLEDSGCKIPAYLAEEILTPWSVLLRVRFISGRDVEHRLFSQNCDLSLTVVKYDHLQYQKSRLA
jgi:hypothetical protein